MNHLEELRLAYGLTSYKAEMINALIGPHEVLLTNLRHADMEWLKAKAAEVGCQLAAVTQEGDRIWLYMDDGNAIFGDYFYYGDSHTLRGMRRSEMSFNLHREITRLADDINFPAPRQRPN